MLDRSEAEERAARCNICAAELSLVENLIYANRCIFCSPLRWKLKLWKFLLLCYLDYKIYFLTSKLIDKKGLESEARILFLGCVAEAGAADVRGIRTVQEKRRLIKILRRYV